MSQGLLYHTTEATLKQRIFFEYTIGVILECTNGICCKDTQLKSCTFASHESY